MTPYSAHPYQHPHPLPPSSIFSPAKPSVMDPQIPEQRDPSVSSVTRLPHILTPGYFSYVSSCQTRLYWTQRIHFFYPPGDYSASSVTPSPSNIPHPPGMVLYSPAKLTLHGHTNTLSLSHPFFSLLVDSSASSVTPALSNTSPPIRHHISYFSPCQTHPSWTHRYTFLLTLHQCVA